MPHKILLESAKKQTFKFLDTILPTAKIEKTDQQWQQILDPKVYEIARNKGTEVPFSGEYCGLKMDGDYYCKVCSQFLFGADSKFDSGTGWPSYFQPATPYSLVEKSDTSFFMNRVEVLCGRCNSHLGHVFDDGPQPTGKRYCINSIVLDFLKPEELYPFVEKIGLTNEEFNCLKERNLFSQLQSILNQVNQAKISQSEAKTLLTNLFLT